MIRIQCHTGREVLMPAAINQPDATLAAAIVAAPIDLKSHVAKVETPPGVIGD